MTALIKKASVAILILLLMVNIWPELRISPSGQIISDPLQFQGNPRITEILIFLLFMLTAARALLSDEEGKHDIRRMVMIFGFFIFLVVLQLLQGSSFSGRGFDYLRIAFIIPLLLFYGITSLDLEKSEMISMLTLYAITVCVGGLILVLSSVGIIRFAQNVDIDAGLQRYSGMGQSLAYSSATILSGIVVCIFLLQRPMRWPLATKILIYTGLTILVIGALLTGARTGYIALAVVMFNVLRSLKNVMVSMGIIFMSIFFFLLVLTLFGLQDILMDLLRARSHFSLANANRIEIWLMALDVFLLHPLIGVEDFFVTARVELGAIPYAHPQNTFLALLLAGGLYLNIPLFIIIFNFVRSFLERIRMDRTLLLLFQNSVIAYGTFALTEIINASIQVQISFIFIVSAMYTLSFHVEWENGTEEEPQLLNLLEG